MARPPKEITRVGPPSPWLAAPIVGIAVGVAVMGAGIRSPMIAMGLVIGLFGALLCLRYPEVGMIALTFLIPLERMQRFTDDSSTFTISIMRLVAMGALASLALHHIFARKSFRIEPVIFPYLLYTVVIVGGFFWSTELDSLKRSLGNIAANILFFFLYTNFLKGKRVMHLIIATWLTASSLSCLYSIIDWHFGSGRTGGVNTEIDPGMGMQSVENRWSTVWEDRAEYETLGGKSARRSMGPTSHAAVYGINLTMAIPFYFYFLSRARKPTLQALLWVCIGMLYYNILLTNTRAVFLIAGIAGAFCLLYGLFKPKTYHVLAALLALTIAIPNIPEDIYNRVLDVSNYSTEKGAAIRIRLEYYKAAGDAIAQYWLHGSGAGDDTVIPRLLNMKTAPRTTVHNIYLQTLIEAGIFGFFFFFFFVAAVYYLAVRAGRRWRTLPNSTDQVNLTKAIQASMLCVLIFGLQVDVFLFPLKGWWLLVCLAVVLDREAYTLLRDKAMATLTAKAQSQSLNTPTVDASTSQNAPANV